ncbi:diguanylate cyclase (GGDEF) domain-containing protein [Novosphingobium sp. CF614]|uniref:GGDEF domain-containing protein n=1 Tax=Novosphingobium sp. CF614 TaxID=1884364 RepID=UPI0008F35C12|nr:GGDEF domain-containing protein [Novosphingobium sp. CF614]SFF83635.1 diguanylate cyclase (GGDEF) domain-containing protein [Novosphingobium sp. CF614]
MRFYNVAAFLFPRSYERRLLLVCLAAIHVPLIASIAFQAITGEWQVATLVMLLAATLVATGIGLAAIHGLLSPVARAATMLQAIPRGGNDLLDGVTVFAKDTAAKESTGRVEREREPTRPVECDPLTGIRNNQGFLDSAEEVLQGEHNAVLVLIGIDHFQLINDQFGQAAAEQLLKSIARRLEDGLRRSDVVARREDEEFAVLLPNTVLDEARMIMERLRASVALDESLSAQGWPVTFSCGLAPVRTFAQFGDAVRRADAALGEAKNGSRNRVYAAMD